MLRICIFLFTILMPLLSFAEPNLPAAFTMDELTPEQKKYVEENYVTTGVLKVDLSKDRPVEARPLTAPELLDTATVLYKHGRLQEALEKAREAITHDPNYWPAYRVQADILQESGAPAQSIPLYNKILAHNPNDDELYMNRGYAFGRLNQFDSAVADYTKALSLNPNSLTAISARAGAYLRLQNIDGAQKDYEQLIDFDAEQGNYGLGHVAASRGNWQEALDYYDKTIIVSPNFAPAYMMKGQILLQLDRKEEAKEAVVKAKSLGMASDVVISNPEYEQPPNREDDIEFDDKSSIEDVMRKTGYYYAIGDFDRAIEVGEKYFQKTNDREAIGAISFSLSSNYLEKGIEVYQKNQDPKVFYQQSIQFAKKHLEIYPQSWRALANIGAVYLNTGDYKQAAAYFWEAEKYIDQNDPSFPSIKASRILAESKQ